MYAVGERNCNAALPLKYTDNNQVALLLVEKTDIIQLRRMHIFSIERVSFLYYSAKNVPGILDWIFKVRRF